jgi:phosphatidylglycerol:prolipoprotein diacylglycerol transferase
MAPILFKIPLSFPYLGHVELPIYGFGIMLVMAFIFAPWLAWWRARRDGLDGDVILDMGFWIFVVGLVGARALYCVEYWGKDIHNLWEAFQYWRGGIVYYGGVVGAMVGFFAYRWFHPFPVRPYMDAIAPSITLGTFFGRIGCFLNGCCYGDQCRLPWAVSFPAESPPWAQQVKAGLISQGATASLPVHPTQLYSALDGLVLLALLLAYYPLRRRDGEVLGVLMIAYPITRFLIEYLRNDEPAILLGMTISQSISVGLLLVAAAYWGWLMTLPVARHPVAESESPEVQPAAARA